MARPALALRIQRTYLKGEEEAGRIKPYQPEQPPAARSLVDTVGLPKHLETLQQDPIQMMNNSISKHMWTSNPGYLVRDGSHMTSRFKQDFVYDEEEVRGRAPQHLEHSAAAAGLHPSPFRLHPSPSRRLAVSVQIEYLRSQGYLGKQHNRRRDDFVLYVEAAAKAKAAFSGAPK